MMVADVTDKPFCMFFFGQLFGRVLPEFFYVSDGKVVLDLNMVHSFRVQLG